MTSTKETSNSKDRTSFFNRWAYGTFVLLSVYFLLVNNDVASAMSNLGIALIFDPFDQRVTWNNRPRYQRVWLFVHVGIVLILFAYWMLKGFNLI